MGSTNLPCECVRGKIFSGGTIGIVPAAQTSKMMIWEPTANKVFESFDFGTQRVVQMENWPEAGLISVVTHNKMLFLVDPRVELPIAGKRLPFEKVIGCHPLAAARCVVRAEAGYTFYDFSGDWEPYLTVTRGTEYMIPKGREIILCDQTGTFTCHPEARSYSLFDQSEGYELPVICEILTLPVERELSLHGHTFPVTAGACDGQVCATADLSGAVHIWSPWTDRIAR
jgi:hypothetical protein